MAQYYFNENPQVTLWIEKYQKKVSDYNKLVAQYNENVEDFNELGDEVEMFNSLPWYKKMFYKFDV